MAEYLPLTVQQKLTKQEYMMNQRFNQLRQEVHIVDDLCKSSLSGEAIIIEMKTNYRHRFRKLYAKENLDLVKTRERFEEVLEWLCVRKTETKEVCEIFKAFKHGIKFPMEECVIIELDDDITIIKRTPDTLRMALERRLLCYDIDKSFLEIVPGPNGPIDWDTSLTSIPIEDTVSIRIEESLKDHVNQYKTHNLECRYFYALTLCAHCEFGLFKGYWCSRCGDRYHFLCAYHLVENSDPSNVPCIKRDMEIHYQQISSNKIRPIGNDLSENCPELRLLQVTNKKKRPIIGRKMESGHVFGVNSFGISYRGLWHGRIQKEPNDQISKLKSLNNRVNYVSELKHDIKIKEIWCQALSLFYHINDLSGEHISADKDKFHIAVQLAHGLDYLHAKNLIVKDLSSHHIYLTDNLTVKISTYNVPQNVSKYALPCSHDRQRYCQYLSAYWLAPEMLTKHIKLRTYTKANDVYAFGMVLYEIFSLKCPYTVDNEKGKHCPILCFTPIEKLHENLPKYIRTIIEKCLDPIDYRRPLMYNVLEKLQTMQTHLFRTIQMGSATNACRRRPTL